MAWNDVCGIFPQLPGIFHTLSTVLKLSAKFYYIDLQYIVYVVMFLAWILYFN